jgi:HSP20 family protein
MVNLVRWDPFKELEDMASAMQRSLDQTYPRSSGSHLALPLMDVFEENNKLVAHMHVGGLTEDELDISVDNGVLIVKGERVVSDEEKKRRNYVLRESSTVVYRRMALPKRADASKVEAHLSDGILRIEIPIKPEAKPKKISVKARRGPATAKSK